MIEIRTADVLEEIKKIPDISVHLIFTDPAYWTLNKWREVGTTTRLGGHGDAEKRTGWFQTIDENELFEFMCECYRILKPDNHCCIMCDGQTLKWVLGYAEEVGFNYCKPIVWDKKKLGMGYHLRNRHEFIVLLDKGKNRKPKDMSIPDVIDWIPMVIGGYPTEKPIALPQLFIEQFTDEGEIVFDGFIGAGSTMLACQKSNRQGIGVDIEERCIEITKERLKTIQEELCLL